jgi:hypothetical protein
MNIFNKRFRSLSQMDQVQVVSAALAKLEARARGSASKSVREKMERRIRKMHREALSRGIYRVHGCNLAFANPPFAGLGAHAGFDSNIVGTPAHLRGAVRSNSHTVPKKVSCIKGF